MTTTQPVEQRPRVLLVDDSPMVLRALDLLMQSLGWDVVKAEDATVALDQIGVGTYQLAVLDFKMPQMDGIQLCQEIRKRTQPQQPVIFILSGYVDSKGRFEAESAGAQAILDKPVGRADLVETLKRHGLPCFA